ncbi:MAG: glutamyl-tRNA reductase [Crocinitomicaceae bacterium]|nr:glutamyl-tRNA reductase [Crocinitomicaceae bacterium]
MLNNYHIIAFTHRNFDVSDIGSLHIEKENQIPCFKKIKEFFELDEVLFISTCNRVEIHVYSSLLVDKDFVKKIFEKIYSKLSSERVSFFCDKLELHHGDFAINHLFSLISSIDSMVIGEREIITQVRNSYDWFLKHNLTGDFLRMAINHAIQTGKKVYSQTNIATRQVSVVSLAYKKLKDQQIPLDAKILVIGAGSTISTFLGRLKKQGYSNFTVFNRTKSNADAIVNDFGGTSKHLSDLENYKNGFDVILSCTGSENYIIDEHLYAKLLNGDTSKKTIIDLAIPQDISSSIVKQNFTRYISINELQKESNANLIKRSEEIKNVNNILLDSEKSFMEVIRERNVEIAMREVPIKIKEIKSIALNEVFRGDIDALDKDAKLVLERVLGYMEKKYISEPMKLAKEIMLKNA